jgi:hypothetical protein
MDTCGRHCVSQLSVCMTNTRENQLTEGKIYFGLQFQKFH